MLEVRLKLITCLNMLGLNSLFVFVLKMLNSCYEAAILLVLI